MEKYWNAIRLLFIGWFLPARTAEDEPDQVAPVKEKRTSTAEEAGRWYFKRDILDRLDDYFICIRRLRATDINSYDLFSRIGAVIISGHERGLQKELPATWNAGQLPGFGAVAYMERGIEKNEDIIPAKFVCFNKYARPPATVEPAAGVVYGLQFFHTRVDDTDRGSHECYLDIADGGVRLLRELHKKKQRIPAKKVKGRKHGVTVIYHSHWGYPPGIKSMAEFHKTEVAEYAADMFLGMIHEHENASLDIRIRVAKGSLVATFAVDMLRTPYFFEDREPVIIDGKKKRIFHIVRTHPRRLQDGRTIPVRSHFKGLRRFDWHGYNINITMPGLHHRDMLRFDIGGHAYDDDTVMPKDKGDTKFAGKLFNKHVNV